MATLAGVLATNAARSPKRDAVIFDDRSYTYAEIDVAVNRAAHALAAVGLRKGDRMLLMSGNSDGFFIALYAAWRLGALVIPVNPASPGHGTAVSARRLRSLGDRLWPGGGRRRSQTR
ncbi:MAG TPA: AMP-binding protein [Mycobacterium sp.]|nr:AMP-binding protein [Mycobacterium sp.]